MKKLLALAAAALFCIGAGIEFILPKEDTFALNTTDNHFYWSPNREALDAATLYRLQNGVDRSKDACKTDNWTPSRFGGCGWANTEPYWPCLTESETGIKELSLKKAPEDVNKGREGSGDGVLLHSADGGASIVGALYDYWYQVKDLAVPEDTEAEQPVKQPRYYICAPSKGTIQTSHYACDGGRSMRFQYTYKRNGKDVTVMMTISNATCWYCCREKDPTNPKSGCDTIDGVTVYKANTPTSLKDRVMEAGQLLCIGNPDTCIMFTLVS